MSAAQRELQATHGVDIAHPAALETPVLQEGCPKEAMIFLGTSHKIWQSHICDI